MLQELKHASETDNHILLAELAQHYNPQIREEVADNRNTPREALSLLAKDSDFGVVFAVAENPSTPRRLLKSLSRSHIDQDIRTVAHETLTRTQNDDTLAASNGSRTNENPRPKRPRPIKHGTAHAYRERKCRCEPCVAAYRARRAAHKARRRQRYKANIGNPPNHGTVTGYQDYKCRCEACTNANLDAEKKRNERKQQSIK